MFNFFSVAPRRRVDELMDQPGLDPGLHAQALRGLARVNLISRTGVQVWREIEKVAITNTLGRPLRVLDVACGGGDLAVEFARKAKHKGFSLKVYGCDISDSALDHARDNTREAGLDCEFFRHDALRETFAESYDIVTCTLFLHHLEPEDAIALLKNLGTATTCLLIIDDLKRTRFGLFLAQVGCRLLTRSHIVHFDGPASVRGAYTMVEAAELAKAAGLEHVDIRPHWPERYLLSWNRI